MSIIYFFDGITLTCNFSQGMPKCRFGYYDFKVIENSDYLSGDLGSYLYFTKCGKWTYVMNYLSENESNCSVHWKVPKDSLICRNIHSII